MPINLKNLSFFFLFAVIAGISYSNSAFQVSAGLFMGLCLLSMLREKNTVLWKDMLVGLAVVYWIASALSLTQSQYPELSWRGLFRIFRSLLLCFSVVYVTDSREKFGKVFYFFLIVAFVVGVDALWQGLTGTEILRGRSLTPYFGQTRRLTGPFHHANDFSAYLSFVTLLFVGAAAGGRPGKKWFFVVAGLAVTVICLLGTYSRGAWVAVGAATFLLACLKRSKWIFLALVGLVLWAAFLSPPLMRERVRSLWDQKNTTMIERKELWGESLRMLADSPWFGLGLNTYARNEPAYKIEGSRTDKQYAHNGYLQIAAETGLVGLLGFLAVIVYFLAASLAAFRKCGDPFLKTAGLSLVCGIVAFLLHSATDTDLQSTLLVNTLWLAVGTAWAAKKILTR